MTLSDLSIHAWLQENGIKTEKGEPLDFRDHLFLFDPYRDQSPKQVILKAAQIGFSTLAVLKALWVAAKLKLDIIYTLPTDDDRNKFVGGKVNRILSQNPVLQQYTKDKDTVEQKQVGDSIIHYRGTFTEKAAIMVPSDLNIYDEVDASRQDIIEQYATRLQHSKYKWEWYFSHPSAENVGVAKYWEKSDQKHWFIRHSCGVEQHLSWPDSIDPSRGAYVCKSCGGDIADDERRKGRWVAKYKQSEERPFSGYWIPLLICPWVTAKEILKYRAEKGDEYFYNKVLGLPYIGAGNKLTKGALFSNLTTDVLTPGEKERVVMGVDTGLKLDYVLGGERGLFYHGEAKNYGELDALMKRWPRMIAVVDAGGDMIGSREFKERWRGRVFLCVTGGIKRSDEPVWNDDEYMVTADRDKMIQLCVDEFTAQRIPIQGVENDWYDYFLDWNNLSRIKVIDPKTQEFKGYKWVRNGRDHRALATVYWRVGRSRFNDAVGGILNPDDAWKPPASFEVSDRGTVSAGAVRQMQFENNQPQEDWRS